MRCLRTFYLLIVGVLVAHLQTNGQTLLVDTGYTPHQLIEDVLIGQGIVVNHIQFSGNTKALGLFYGPDSNIGLNGGLILSTGLAVDAEGPNGTPFSDAGTEFNGPGDSVLTVMSNSSLGTFDAAILEFDFQSFSDTIYLRYVFASNEYMIYVGAGVNDVFAFLISGPGIIGEQNLALISGTSTPVAINNINANTNAEFYIDNENPPGATVEYNGFTQVLTAHALITPSETYHVRIAVADGGDASFDSAVFLEAGSFTSTLIGLGVEAAQPNSEHSVFPNPASHQVTIAFNNPDLSVFELTLTDALGRLVHSENTDQASIQLSTSEFHNGIYYYQLISTERPERMLGRFVVLKE